MKEQIRKIENPEARKAIAGLITDFEIDNPKTSKMDLIHFAQVVYSLGFEDGKDSMPDFNEPADYDPDPVLPRHNLRWYKWHTQKSEA